MTLSQGKPRLSDRLPSLDGLRAISITLVIACHLNLRHNVYLTAGPIGDYGRLGVLIFFVISGFLITTLLLSEHERYGQVSLRLFYARRALRIFPASYCYILVITCLSVWGVIRLSGADLWHAVTYTMNYLPGRSVVVAHLWSLSVEEQFYLLWPFAFVALGRRSATTAAAGVLVFAIFARAADRLFLHGTPYYGLEMFPMVADSLAAGCLLASLRNWLEQQRWYLRLLQSAWSLLILLAVLALNHYEQFTAVDRVFGTTILNIGLAVLIHRCVYRAHDPLARFLNWRPIAFVGVLSYSLYVWQELFLNWTSRAWWNQFPQNLIFAVAASLASYFLLEKPFLGLRQRLRARSAEPERLPAVLSSTVTIG